MNSFFMDYWPHISSAAVGLGALWGLLSKANSALVSHMKAELGETFATKTQLDRVEGKLDSLIDLSWSKPRGVRKSSAEVRRNHLSQEYGEDR